MATVWARQGRWASSSVLDRAEVTAIAPTLTTASRVSGNAYRLHANRDRSFQGTVVVGMGFVLSPGEAAEMIASDQRNAQVVRPYLTGEDLNSRPDQSPSRWVIDFRDWHEEQARMYHQPFERSEILFRPERARVNREAHRVRWWQFGDKRPALYRTIAPLSRVIVVARVTKHRQPAFVRTDIVYSDKVAVICYDDDAMFGVLNSTLHWWWVVTHAATMGVGATPYYSPTDCFETYPQPALTDAIASLGGQLNEHRSALMLDRQEGLTKTYNRVHDPEDHSDDIARLRELHLDLDYAVRDAYGWTDLDLAHGFHETKFGTRFTFAPGPRQEVLDRLLELNQARYAQEVARGLHGKPKAKGKHKAPAGSMAMELDGV